MTGLAVLTREVTAPLSAGRRQFSSLDVEQTHMANHGQTRVESDAGRHKEIVFAGSPHSRSIAILRGSLATGLNVGCLLLSRGYISIVNKEEIRDAKRHLW